MDRPIVLRPPCQTRVHDALVMLRAKLCQQCPAGATPENDHGIAIGVHRRVIICAR